jgi:dihydroorotase
VPEIEINRNFYCFKCFCRRLAAAFVILIAFNNAFAQEQQYDLLIKGGHLIDPKNSIDSKMDIAIAEGRIAKISENIPASQARKVTDATGFFVVPGLIDIHTHVFTGNKPGTFADGISSVAPDHFTFRSGVTTVVDAGTSGWRNFADFKKQVIDLSQTRVLAFVNIAGSGMQGDPYEQDLNDMDPHMTSLIIKKFPEIIVGTKIGHYTGNEWAPFDRALKAGKISDTPLLIECHLPELPLNEVLEKLRPGDIFTHAFGKVNDRASVIDDQGKVKPFVWEAQKKGVRFDVGHGGGSFHFSEAVPALEQGLLPDAFGTDLHKFSMNSGMKDMLNIMSKYLNMGMKFKEIIHRASWNSAQTIKREDLGHLSEGAVADVAVLSIKKGSFGFIDSSGNKLEGDQKIEAELTIRAGKIVWDLNGMAAQKWVR